MAESAGGLFGGFRLPGSRPAAPTTVAAPPDEPSATSPSLRTRPREAASAPVEDRSEIEALASEPPAQAPAPASKQAPAKKAAPRKKAPAKRTPAKKKAASRKAPAKKQAPAKRAAPRPYD
jgi:hypothetical protein